MADDPAAYLAKWVQQMDRGYRVDFAADPSLALPNNTLIRVDPSRLVLGFSFGSRITNAGKSVLIQASDVQRAFESVSRPLEEMKQAHLGAAEASGLHVLEHFSGRRGLQRQRRRSRTQC